MYGEFTEVGWIPPEHLAYQEWEGHTFAVSRIGSAINFFIGDAIIYGQDNFGETYSQVVDELGLDMQTVYNYVWVARSIPIERRVIGLSWEHHKIVAGQVDDLQDYWLARALEEGWSTRDLRGAMKGNPPALLENTDGFVRPTKTLIVEFLMLAIASDDDATEWLRGLSDAESEKLAGELEYVEEKIEALTEDFFLLTGHG
jgi:hypothetical protein